MMLYNIVRNNVTLSGTTPLFTIVPNLRSLLLLEIDVEGDGTASAYNEMALYRVLASGTGGATANTNVAQPVDQPNMTGTTPLLALAAAVNTTYATTQPTFTATAPVHNIPINSNGQRYFWRANANLNNAIVIAPLATNAGLVLAPITGTGIVSVRLQVAEL